MTDTLSFELVSPEALVLAGDAQQVVVPGSEGYFTVMANHAPMMSSMKPGVVDVVMADGSKSQIFVRGGFADISPEGFTLLAEEATDLKDMNEADIDQHIKDAEEDVADADTDEKKEKAQAILAQLKESKDAIAYARANG